MVPSFLLQHTPPFFRLLENARSGYTWWRRGLFTSQSKLCTRPASSFPFR